MIDLNSSDIAEEVRVRIAELEAEVARLQNRLNTDSQEFTILCLQETEKTLRKRLAEAEEHIARLETSERLKRAEEVLENVESLIKQFYSVISFDKKDSASDRYVWSLAGKRERRWKS